MRKLSPIFTGLSLAMVLVLSPLTAQDTPQMTAEPITLEGSEIKQDFQFPNIDVRSAFRALSTAAGVDIALSPKVTGRISLNLTQKTWKEALKVLCQMLSLMYSVEKEYIYVQTFEEYNANLKEADLTKEIIKIKHSKAIDMENAVKGLLSPRGRVTVIQQSNAIIVQDVSDKITEIKGAIQELDVETYQVHIQAQIVEVSSDASLDLGVNWSFSNGNLNSQNGGVRALSQSGTVSPGELAEKGNSLAFGVLNGSFIASIENLVTEGKGEVVARPQITTLDNKEATIFIGRRIPFNKLDQDRNSTLEFVDGGIELIVTPHITNDDRIILDLAPKKSGAEIEPQTRAPIVTTQEAKTTVIVNDGQTVVIGGLTSKDEKEIETGIPILKDIPLLGALFRYKQTKELKNDLVIFVTPHIVKNQVKVTNPDPTASPVE